jgi:hypothetical protein
VNTRQWESYFGTMGWSGGTFGAGVYTDGGTADTQSASPTDQIQYLLEGRMRADALLAAVFGGNGSSIERMGVRPEVDLRSLPRLYIYSGAVDGSLITLSDERTVSVFVEVVFAISSVTSPSPGGATLASLMDYIAKFLTASQELSVLASSTPGASAVPLCQVVTVKPFQTLLIEEKGGARAFSQIVQADFQTLIDYRTGRFVNLPPIS